MNSMLVDWVFAVPFLDDMLIERESWNQHNEHIKMPLKGWVTTDLMEVKITVVPDAIEYRTETVIFA